MGELIQIGKEGSPPRVVCPHCGETILMDLDPFKNDVTKVWKDQCPKCHGMIYVGMMILAHPKFEGLLACLKTIIEAVNPKKDNLIIS